MATTGQLIQESSIFNVSFQAFWRSAGYSGEVVSNGGDGRNGCTKDPINVVMDATSGHGNPALVGFISGDQGIQWANKTVSASFD